MKYEKVFKFNDMHSMYTWFQLIISGGGDQKGGDPEFETTKRPRPRQPVGPNLNSGPGGGPRVQFPTFDASVGSQPDSISPRIAGATMEPKEDQEDNGLAMEGRQLQFFNSLHVLFCLLLKVDSI